MAGKHYQSSFAARHRYPLIVGFVVLCVAVAGTLAGFANHRDPEPSLLVTPASTGEPTPPPVSAPPTSVSPSSSSSPSAPAPATPSPSVRRSSARPATAASFAARYFAVSTGRSGFRAGILITNQGRTARTWRLVITHDPADGVRVVRGSGARMVAAGSTITFDGGPLEPGTSVSVAYQATATTSGSVRPASCRIAGASCVVTEWRYRNESPGARR